MLPGENTRQHGSACGLNVLQAFMHIKCTGIRHFEMEELELNKISGEEGEFRKAYLRR